MTNGKIQCLLHSVGLTCILWESYMPSVYIFRCLNIFFFFNCPLFAPAHVLSTGSSIPFLFSCLTWVPGCHLHPPCPPLLSGGWAQHNAPAKPRQGSPSAVNPSLPNMASGPLAEQSIPTTQDPASSRPGCLAPPGLCQNWQAVKHSKTWAGYQHWQHQVHCGWELAAGKCQLRDAVCKNTWEDAMVHRKALQPQPYHSDLLSPLPLLCSLSRYLKVWIITDPWHQLTSSVHTVCDMVLCCWSFWVCSLKMQFKRFVCCPGLWCRDSSYF